MTLPLSSPVARLGGPALSEVAARRIEAVALPVLAILVGFAVFAVFIAALGKAGKTVSANNYAGVNHAFNNDTGAARYNKAAAELAWSRTLAFFAENLGAPPKAA